MLATDFMTRQPHSHKLSLEQRALYTRATTTFDYNCKGVDNPGENP